MSNPSLIQSIVVTLPTGDLRVSVVPVTRAQYKRVSFEQPERLPYPTSRDHQWVWVPGSGRLPATGISYLEAVAWIAALNQAERRTGASQWRLPHAAEWNEIVRAGRGESGHAWCTAAEQAREGWFALDGAGIPPVKMRRPSPVGLYDLWTVKTWTPEGTLVGHHWYTQMPSNGYPSGGQIVPPTEQSPFVGLRLVCDDTERTGEVSFLNWAWNSPEAVAEAVARDRRWQTFTVADLARLREESV